MTLQEYLRDPCGSSSIPYWKLSDTAVPDNIRIVHQRDFCEDMLEQYEDEVYFRLKHDFGTLPELTPPEGLALLTIDVSELDTVQSIINRSYASISVSRDTLVEYTGRDTYRPELWILAVNEQSGEKLGCAIAEYDAEAQEMSIEWVQVLPEHRRMGIGSAMVSELLSRAPEEAKFATVSGKADDPLNPEGIYRRCGFTGDDRWHVLTENPIAIEQTDEGAYRLLCAGEYAAEIRTYRSPFHERNCYLLPKLHKPELLTERAFSLLRRKIGSPLQVMMPSGDWMVPTLLRCGFECRRRCWSYVVSDADLSQPLPTPAADFSSCAKGSSKYDRCLQLLYEHYKCTHLAVSQLTASLEEFTAALDCACFYQEQDGEIAHCAFVEDNEIAYISSRDLSALRHFVQAITAYMLEKCGEIVFEADDCDPAAMTLRSLFTAKDGIPFCTYILD